MLLGMHLSQIAPMLSHHTRQAAPATPGGTHLATPAFFRKYPRSNITFNQDLLFLLSSFDWRTFGARSGSAGRYGWFACLCFNPYKFTRPGRDEAGKEAAHEMVRLFLGCSD